MTSADRAAAYTRQNRGRGAFTPRQMRRFRRKHVLETNRLLADEAWIKGVIRDRG